MARVYNFSAGPSMLPEWVLKTAASELTEFGTSGQSVMEMSHRSPEYEAIINNCEALLREVMAIPSNYKVLFLQGGASLQFSMIPMNLLAGSGKADVVHTGMWTKKAMTELKKLGTCNLVASSEDKNFSYIPTLTPDMFSKDADYAYICLNNTIYGTKYVQLPNTGEVPLVADLSSCILSEPIDVSKYGLIFAGAQKNMGPAGLTTVIIREDLIGRAKAGTPSMLDYKIHLDNDSMFNTPPTYAIYMCGLVLQWLKEQMGGLAGMEKINKEKAALLYSYLDGSKLFSSPVDPKYRSMMNITFVTGNKELDGKFVKEATAHGFVNLKGHRAVGGMRASIYNAMPVEGVRALVAFMQEFEAANA